jgi:hypothetical protein
MVALAHMAAEWDFFISHASEDKAAVARPLAEELVRAGFRVWLDVFEIKVGVQRPRRTRRTRVRSYDWLVDAFRHTVVAAAAVSVRLGHRA